MSKDLRSFLRDLDAAGQLIKVHKEVDVDKNMGTLNIQAVRKHQKAILYDNIKGFPGWRACSAVTGTRKNVSVALSMPVNEMAPRLAKIMREGELKPCPKVESGPVKDFIYLGDDVNLYDLPINVVSEIDNGRYIGSGWIVVEDPETGIANISVHRHQVKAKDKMGIMMVVGKHAWMIYQKYKKMKKDMPVSLVVGHHGIVQIASCWSTAFGIDEHEIAQLLMGEPLNMVKSETNDLYVPADAELVIEGYVPWDIVEPEGPFGEHTGCTIAGAGKNPIVQITAITHRKDPIFFQITEGPNTDGAILDAIPMEVELYNRTKDVGGGIDLKTVVVHECAGGGHFVVAQITPHYPGEAKGVLASLLSSNYLHPKIAVVVDDDVDPSVPSEIIWSMSTKVNPQADVFIIPGTPGHSLDASLPRVSPLGQNPVIRVGSRMGIDATKPVVGTQERDDMYRFRGMGADEYSLDDFLD